MVEQHSERSCQLQQIAASIEGDFLYDARGWTEGKRGCARVDADLVAVLFDGDSGDFRLAVADFEREGRRTVGGHGDGQVE